MAPSFNAAALGKLLGKCLYPESPRLVRRCSPRCAFEVKIFFLGQLPGFPELAQSKVELISCALRLEVEIMRQMRVPLENSAHESSKLVLRAETNVLYTVVSASRRSFR